MNIGTLLPRHARYRPDHPALVFQESAFSYRELHERCRRLARALLAMGLEPGDRIATVLPNCPELVQLYWAAAGAGLVAVPLSPLLSPQAVDGLARDSGSRAVFAGPVLVDALHQGGGEPADYQVIGVGPAGTVSVPHMDGLLETVPDEHGPLPQVEEQAALNIIYSSGTTGEPKGIVLSHRVRSMYATLFAAALRMRSESVVLHTGSIVFNGAFVTLMPALYLGATYVLHAGFEPRALIRAVREHGVTHMMLVPSQIVALLECPDFTPGAMSTLETLCSVGAPLHRRHKERLAESLPGRFYELYGLTEGFATILDRDDYARKPDSVGTPPPFFALRIQRPDGSEAAPGEVGEICGQGPILMSGYHNRPDLTAETVVDGWLHTGDLGYVDEDGFLFLVDRKKDLIISGGVNVYPRDIEEVVVRHPAVREAAVFGVEDPRWGETPVAAVVPRQAGAVDGADLRAWINSNVQATYQRVSDVMVVSDFPRNTAGKTLKRTLRERYLAGGRAGAR